MLLARVVRSYQRYCSSVNFHINILGMHQSDNSIACRRRCRENTRSGTDSKHLILVLHLFWLLMLSNHNFDEHHEISVNMDMLVLHFKALDLCNSESGLD